MKLEKYEQEHLDFVRSGAAECTLFLKKDQAFPLDAPCKIAAFGDGVRHTVKGGTGSGEVNSRFSVNIEQGLADAGFEITTKEWLDAYDKKKAEAHKRYLADLKKEAKKAHVNAVMFAMGRVEPAFEYDLALSGEGDVAIYVLARNSGEGNDRQAIKGDVKLTESEVRDILALDEKYSKFMLVLNVGGVVDLSPVLGVSNILLLSQLGVVTGSVLADILLGRQNPSGKLATSWARAEDYCSLGDFGGADDNNYKEGIYVGYRYFDTSGVKPLFPFGYGQGYSEFELHPLDISLAAEGASLVKVEAEVRNTAAIPGKEVLQLYLSSPVGKLDKPYQALAAFTKTEELAAGESTRVSLSFDLCDLASYDEESAAYILEAGAYILRLGNSSEHTEIVAVIELDRMVVVKKVKNVLGKPGFTDERLGSRTEASLPANVKRLALAAEDIRTEEVSYDREYEISPIVDAMTDEELAYMNMGHFTKGKGLSVIGNAASHVAGAAGESSDLLEKKGYKPIVMADGPAGLRLAKEYYLDEKGAHGVGTSAIPESMMEMMTGITGFFMKLLAGPKPVPKGAEIREQYATAIPIGTAIAQSYNDTLARDYGDMVGSEMERFGVSLWLAPALNIHRTIFCGRNFEYYSEDPLVSGMIAAAITEGVQTHRHCGTTIKHYAFNNAETNRYANSSNLSERAAREIYLKGFEICVKKAQPRALMTSYNLVNGIHTSEHRGLIEDILRCEFGYQGIVMTDWVISMMAGKGKYRGALSSEVAKAGGDLFMPGSQEDYETLLQAIRDGSVSREQAKINASRVLKQL